MEMAGAWRGPRGRGEAIGGEGGGRRGHGRRSGRVEDASMDLGAFAEAEGGDSKVSTIVEVDLGNRSYPIYIGFGFARQTRSSPEKTLMKVFDNAIESRMDQHCTIVALGGGVIGDMRGFAAAAFLRGVNFIQILTTLIAQVDSSVGGGTGINHPVGKSLIGAFYQPQSVLIDTDTLNKLPDRELALGIAEVVKHGLIRDAKVF